MACGTGYPSPMDVPGILVKDDAHVGLFPGSTGAPLVTVPISTSAPHCSHHYGFAIWPEIRECNASSSVPSEDRFGYLGSFVVSGEF